MDGDKSKKMTSQPQQNYFGPREVIFSSENNLQFWNTCVWDLFSGSVLHTFKGGISHPKSLNLLKDDYLISVEQGKPLIHYWPLNRKANKVNRLYTPGKPQCLKVTPDGKFLLAGIAEKLHIWQISSGLMVSMVTQHFQPIKCIETSSDSALVFTAGEDSSIVCWSLARLIDLSCQKQPDPLHTWTNHSLPITDLYVSPTGSKCRVFSTSLDQTLRVWDAWTGAALVTFTFDVSLTSVCCDAAGASAYVGTMSGNIHRVALHQQTSGREVHMKSSANSDETSPNSILAGHESTVTALQLNIDDTMLVSGSKDCTVRIWHCASNQCVKTLTHKGAVTNVIVTLLPPSLISDKFNPTLHMQQLQRSLEISGSQHDGSTYLTMDHNSQLEIDNDIAECLNAAESSFIFSRSQIEALAGGDSSCLGGKSSTQDEEIILLKSQLAQALEENKQLSSHKAAKESGKNVSKQVKAVKRQKMAT